MSQNCGFLAEKERFEFAKVKTRENKFVQFCQPQSRFSQLDIYGKIN